MLQRGGRLFLSPSDLNNFLACEHRTALDLARARGETVLQRVPRPDAELIAERGREHEREHLQRLRERGLDVVEIAPGEGAPEATVEAMRAGPDVIHQAQPRHTSFVAVWPALGVPDAPVRTSAVSGFGAQRFAATHLSSPACTG